MRENTLLPDFNAVIDFHRLTVDDIKEATRFVMKQADEMVGEIIAIPHEQRSAGNTLWRFDDLHNELEKAHASIFLMAYVHPDGEIRAESLNSIRELSKYENRINMNVDLYRSLKEYSKQADTSNMREAEVKLLRDVIREFEQNGLGLPEEKRAHIQKIQDDIADLGIHFESNISSYQDHIILGESDMEGLPEDYKEARRMEDGRYKIDLTYPSFFPFMKYAGSDDARRELSYRFKNIAADKNLEVLSDLLNKRKELAKMLGYSTFAEYQLENRMAEKPSVVWDFQQAIRQRVRDKAEEDYNLLMEKKKAYKGSASRVYSWENAYYRTLLLKEDYHVDDEQVKEYFELDRVIRGLFDVAGQLYGIRFREIDQPPGWHKEVRMFEVSQDDQVIGRFFLDLFPRADKFNHAACFTMIPGKETSQGYQKPLASLVTNFPRATKNTPSLLTHSDVVTFFHEFGHLMHDLLTQAPFSAQSGTSTKRDFVEVPSQLFEHWAWEYESLKRFAVHYQTGEVLPEELHQKMVDAKNLGSGLFTLQQIFYGMLDMTLHDRYDPDRDSQTTTDIVSKLQNEITFFEYMQGTHFEAGFGHLYGYAAGYYGYLWSKVYAEDMFSLFREKGVLSKTAGNKFRRSVLEKGASQEEKNIVRSFLGRQAQYDAFLQSIGVK
ncbi:MAG: Zn-dependent oligopeptidase [Bacteroidales bacterium]|nr:Zn-dependent oligopeptidase [Bacteroidales bacterium]